MKTIVLKLTSAIAIDGDICRRGELVEVDEALAINLLNRGKAELATQDDMPEDAAEEVAEEVDLDGLNKAQLAEIAEQKGLDVSGMTKAQIKAAIEGSAAE